MEPAAAPADSLLAGASNKNGAYLRSGPGADIGCIACWAERLSFAGQAVNSQAFRASGAGSQIGSLDHSQYRASCEAIRLFRRAKI
jgi:hypothetical protein